MEPKLANSKLELDREYIRELGEEIRARLFPRPKQVILEDGSKGDGPTPYALPVAASYQPAESIKLDMLFIPVRSIQYVGESPEAKPLSTVVVVRGDFTFTADLEFGNSPALPPDLGGPASYDKAVAALLHSIAGVG